jgi:hypothetical protein
VRDPNAPAGVKSAFIFYLGVIRAAVRASQPDIKSVELTKVIGAQWNQLSTAERQVRRARVAVRAESQTPARIP